jgi:hypothetical protein
VAALLLALSAVTACNDKSVAADQGLREPIRARGGQFIEGPLPGSPPGSGVPGPKVTAVSLSSRIVLPGQSGKAVDGRATSDASAVAVRLGDLGSGYWVFVLGSADVQFPGENDWHTDLDYNVEFASHPGFHPLRFVAIDANGNAGEQTENSVCLASKVPDNQHACDPSKAAPDAVFSLAWDTDVDLDLRVVTPTGAVIDPRNPTTGLDDAGAPRATDGVFDRDSVASCVKDGLRQEDLSWQARPAGTYDVYANLFDACGRQAVDFTLTIRDAKAGAPVSVSGHLIATDANGGSGLGQFLYSYTF